MIPCKVELFEIAASNNDTMSNSNCAGMKRVSLHVSMFYTSVPTTYLVGMGIGCAKQAWHLVMLARRSVVTSIG